MKMVLFLMVGMLAFVILGPTASATSVATEEASVIVVGGGSGGPCSVTSCVIGDAISLCNWAAYTVDHGQCYP